MEAVANKDLLYEHIEAGKRQKGPAEAGPRSAADAEEQAPSTHHGQPRYAANKHSAGRDLLCIWRGAPNRD